jgi:NitT/TauT family transport system substrate-binding protein
MRKLLGVATGLAVLGSLVATNVAEAQTKVRVGWCAKTVSSAAAPFAVATKLGWFEKLGITVELVPLPGSGDCAKFVATGDTMFALPSVEPISVMRNQGAKLKTFYTAYQKNVYGLAVPADSTVQTMKDLKGKKIGVIGMASASALIVRALAKEDGLDPDKDISVVVVGEAGQTAALVRSGAVQALSQYDTQYALVDNAGVKLRRLVHPSIDKFPSNGFVALEDTLVKHRKEAIALAQGYAMGTLFSLTNPEAAIRIMWSVWPQTRSTSKSEEAALKDDMATLNARAASWRYESVGATKWGENIIANYQAYLDWLLANGTIKQAASAKEIIDNSLIDEIGRFDADAVIRAAREWKPN